MRLGPPRALIALLALTVTTFSFVTTEALPIGLLAPIATDLGVAPSAVGLLVSGYGLVVVLTSIPLTRLTQRLPRRSLLLVLVVIFVVATAASAATTTYGMLLAARLVVALSQALFWSIIIPAVASLFDPGVRGRAVSILYAGGSLAAVLGVPAGTWLGQVTAGGSPSWPSVASACSPWPSWRSSSRPRNRARARRTGAAHPTADATGLWSSVRPWRWPARSPRSPTSARSWSRSPGSVTPRSVRCCSSGASPESPVWRYSRWSSTATPGWPWSRSSSCRPSR